MAILFHFFSLILLVVVFLHYRSYLYVVTAAILVYKTMNRLPCLCTKKILWELNSFHVLKLLFYSKQFAKLLTTRLKTISFSYKASLLKKVYKQEPI